MKLDPNLMSWVNSQLARGLSRQTLLKAMVQQGWSESVAKMALAHAMGKVMVTETAAVEASETASGAPNAAASVAAQIAQAQASQEAATSNTTIPLPGPDLEGSPMYVQTSDRRVEIWTVVKHPRVIVFGNLLSEGECDVLIDRAQSRFARSLTVDTATGNEKEHSARTSRGMFFARGEFDVVERVERRIAELVRWPFENGEGLQVLHYGPGAEYKPHYDYFDPKMAGTPRLLERGGQRVGTLVMYLKSPEKGGATVFPDIGLEVAPVRGSGVFFSYATPTEDTLTLHGGAPVVAGEKYVLTKWMRQGRFD